MKPFPPAGMADKEGCLPAGIQIEHHEDRLVSTTSLANRGGSDCRSRVGMIASSQGWGQWTRDWISPFGTIFITLLKLIAVPLVITSLVSGVASLSDVRKLSRMGGKTIALYLGTTALAVTLGLLWVNAVQPGKSLPQ